uniref:Knottin scorpion toxin-like domain-containing protein n=1 Tax=Oryza punctata TaxID=4537 RepID=A0A0E0JW50_ORYPU
MEFQSSKVAAAVMIFFLLTTGGAAGACSVGESTTFKGNCEIDGGGCVDACRGEGYTDGYCFINVANPGYHMQLMPWTPAQRFLPRTQPAKALKPALISVQPMAT